MVDWGIFYHNHSNLANDHWKTILKKNIRTVLEKNIVLSTIDIVMDKGTSHGVDQDSKAHGYGCVGEDNKIYTSITTKVVEDKK